MKSDMSFHSFNSNE